MSELKITVKRLEIPLKESFKHASADRSVGESLWVVAKLGAHSGFGEGCPRVYVTGEELGPSIEWAETMAIALMLKSPKNLSELQSFMLANDAEISKHPAAWCALELALLDVYAKAQGCSLESLLGVSEEKHLFRYTAVLSADEPKRFGERIARYAKYGFTDFKLKVMGDAAVDYPRLRAFGERFGAIKNYWPLSRSLFPLFYDLRLRLDGNNAWKGRESELDAFLKNIPFKPWAIEEPFAAFDLANMHRLIKNHGVSVILDESLRGIGDITSLDAYPGAWIPNLRVSKLGGLLKSLEVLRAAQARGLSVIVGAQVGESSVLSRAALVLARAAGKSLVAQEGAFGEMLLKEDPVKPVVQFSVGGFVFHRSHNQVGSGLKGISV